MASLAGAGIGLGSQATIREACELREHYRYSADTERQLLGVEQFGSVANTALTLTGITLMAIGRRRAGAVLSVLGASGTVASELGLRQSARRVTEFEAKAEDVQKLIDQRQVVPQPQG